MVTSYKIPILRLKRIRQYQQSGQIGRIRRESRYLQMLRVVCREHRELRSLRDYHTKSYSHRNLYHQPNLLKHTIRQKNSQSKAYLTQTHCKMERWKVGSDTLGRKTRGIRREIRRKATASNQQDGRVDIAPRQPTTRRYTTRRMTHETRARRRSIAYGSW